MNFAGEWTEGGETPISHGNARYTMRMEYLSNLDPNWDDPKGVKVDGVVYGGRDRDTTVPCEESFDWTNGILMKLSLDLKHFRDDRSGVFVFLSHGYLDSSATHRDS